MEDHTEDIGAVVEVLLAVIQEERHGVVLLEV